jgi:hypothetical protein
MARARLGKISSQAVECLRWRNTDCTSQCDAVARLPPNPSHEGRGRSSSPLPLWEGPWEGRQRHMPDTSLRFGHFPSDSSAAFAACFKAAAGSSLPR